MSYITISNLSLRYGSNDVLKDVSLQIQEGELCTLLGPSGCGKSTLLRTIAGLEEFQSGELYLDGRDISSIQPKDRQVGMVFQSYALFPNMTVFDNVAFSLKIKKETKQVIAEKVITMLRLVGLEDKAEHYPAQLSGGQQQRVSLARSLVMEPKVLLLDEPLSALDAKIRKQLQTDIRKLQRKLGITMIFVTHDQEEAMVLSDRIFIMEHGEIVQSAEPSELYASPRNQFVARFIGNYNVLSFEELSALAPDWDSTSAAGTFAIRSELIQLSGEPSSQAIICRAELEEYTVMGNTIRCRFKTGHLVLHADILNTQANISLLENKHQDLYIDRCDIVALEESPAMTS